MSSSQKQIYSLNSDNAYVWEQGQDMTSLYHSHPSKLEERTGRVGDQLVTQWPDNGANARRFGFRC